MKTEKIKHVGILIWNSVKESTNDKGEKLYTSQTYVKAKHGPIGTQYKTGTQKRNEARANA
jgi:hypothetical protein